jgi:RNA polymerase sigma-70 factor (ECF subfamily)
MRAMSDSTLSSRPPRGLAEQSRLRGLFGELAEGRVTALEGLYDSCGDELYGLALWRTGSSADAADVVQEVFVQLTAVRHRLKDIGDPMAYLRRMTSRASVDVHRKRLRRREEPVETCLFLETPEPSPERETEARRVSRLLERLPPRQREAIYLRHFCGCSHAEIGRATGVATFTAASRYRLGIQRLRALLGVTK